MRSHYLRIHKEEIKADAPRIQLQAIAQLSQLYAKAHACGETTEIDKQVFENYLNKEVIDEALVSLVVVRNVAFSLVEWPEFHVVCQALNPISEAVIPNSHNTIQSKVEKAFYDHKDVVRKTLQSALTHIHLSMDIWTSPNDKLVLGITADFIECEEERHTKALIALRPIQGHSGQAQCDVLIPVLQEYSIVRKLGAVVGDNSTTNDTLTRAIQEHLSCVEDIEWEHQSGGLGVWATLSILRYKPFYFGMIRTLRYLRGHTGVVRCARSKRGEFPW
jgi:hypothetical protein